jgi:hypothetical protein
MTVYIQSTKWLKKVVKEDLHLQAKRQEQR